MTDEQKPSASETPSGTEAPATASTDAAAVTGTTDNPAGKASEKPASPPPRGNPPVKPPAKQSDGSGKGFQSGLLWLVLLLLAGGMTLTGYVLWQQQEGQEGAIAELRDRLDEQLEQWDGRSAQLARAIQRDLELQADSQERELTALRQELASTSRRLIELSATTRDDWKLAEAEYLLRLASQRLVVERNSGTALALAQTADQLLRELDDTDLHPVRRALARDISTLKMIEPIDREGLYLRLLMLIDQADALSARGPLGEPLKMDEPRDYEAEFPPKSRRWRHRVKASFSRLMAQLSQHLRVRTHSSPAVDVVLPPESEIYLRWNLRLMLEQAQAAMLREEELVYQSSLARARDWLAQHYSRNPQAERLQEELAQLQEQTISQPLPGIGEALSLLKTYIEQRHRLGPSAAEDDA